MTDKANLQAGALVSAPFQREPNLRQRILVVEDDAVIRELNTEGLTYSGYQVDAAEDGQAAWAALQLHNYDLVVTDNNMPKMTGVELIKKLQDARKFLPVIMATGTLPDEEFARYPCLQPAVMLLKPYALNELLNAVKTVLRATSDALQETAPPPNWPVEPLANHFRL
jgi:DNA-binding response OmpR family regulator